MVFIAVVEEYRFGNCHVYIHDDYIVKTQEEKDAIIKELERIVSRDRTKRILKELEESGND